MTDYDSPWKEALDVWFELFLAFFFPAIHADIDWSCGWESLDKELQSVVRDAELGRRYADKLVKVWRKNGDEAWVLIHVEVQGCYEPDFGRRICVYNYRIFDRYNREVVSLVVLADDRPGWRPDGFEYSLWGCTAGIRFRPVKLLDYAPQVPALEASPNPFARVVLAHLKAQETDGDPGERYTWKVRLVRGLYERGFSADDVRQLFRLIDWMMELPPALEGLFKQDLQRLEEERRMPFITSIERLGREEGMREGHREGLREGLLKGIELGLKLRFGTEGLKLLDEIRQLTDVEMLQTIHQAIEEAPTPDDLRRTWSR